MKFLSVHTLCAALVVLCLFAGGLLRLNFFDSTGSNFYFVDVARDYLIAEHTIEYGEIPLTGSDGYAGSYASSPAYYYLLSLLYFINGGVFFSGIVNVVLQTFCIFLVYLIARKMFGRTTACIATVFFALFDGVIGESLNFWQPHIMQPFLLGSLLLLVAAHQNKRDAFLYGSGVLFACALVLHNSVVGVLPVYAIAFCLVLYLKKPTRTTVVLSIASLLLPLVVLGFPALLYFLQHMHHAPVSALEAMYRVPGPEPVPLYSIPMNFFVRFALFAHYLFEGKTVAVVNFMPTVYTYISMFALSFGSAAYLFLSKNRERRMYMLFLSGAVLCLLCAIAFLGIMSQIEFPVRYFTPIYAVALILTAEMIGALWRRSNLLKVPAVLIFCIVCFFGMQLLPQETHTLQERFLTSGIRGFVPKEKVPEDIQALIAIIKDMKEQEGKLPDFDVRTFRIDFEDQYLDSIMWLPLETAFGEHLVKVDDTAFRGISVAKTPSHIFVRCLALEEGPCTEFFMNKYHEQYKVEGVVYTSKEVTYLHATRK